MEVALSLVKNITFAERKTSNLLEHSYVRNRNPSSVADSMGTVVYYSYDMRNCLKKKSAQGQKPSQCKELILKY